MIQTIKLEHSFDAENWNFKDGVKDDRQFPNNYLEQQSRCKAFKFWLFIDV